METNNFNLKGSIVALVTPFTSDGSIDFLSFERLIEFQIKNNSRGIVVCGTTGEAVTLRKEEYGELIGFAVRKAAGRVPIIAGSGGNCTENVLENSQLAEAKGADALLIVTPYYNKPTSAGVIRHFSTIANNVNLPIILYNVPGRTGMDLDIDVVMWLAEKFNNIVGIKESSGNLAKVMDLVARRQDGFHVYSGDDNLAVAAVLMGADGCISVVANQIPAQFSQMMDYALNGQTEQARQLHYRYLNLMNLNFIESNPVPVKTSLCMMGLINENFRLPLYKMVSKYKRSQIQHELEVCGLVRASEEFHSCGTELFNPVNSGGYLLKN